MSEKWHCLDNLGLFLSPGSFMLENWILLAFLENWTLLGNHLAPLCLKWTLQWGMIFLFFAPFKFCFYTFLCLYRAEYICTWFTLLFCSCKDYWLFSHSLMLHHTDKKKTPPLFICYMSLFILFEIKVFCLFYFIFFSRSFSR